MRLHSAPVGFPGFDTILDDVARDGEANGYGGRAAHVAYRFVPLFDAPSEVEGRSAEAWSEAFVWIAADEPPQSEPESLPEPAVDLTTEELGITAGMTTHELRRLRREYALRHHPDRLDPALREAATRRMTSVNAIIDAAIEARRSDRG